MSNPLYDVTCPECDGACYVTCDDCTGHGYERPAGAVCLYCDGTGEVKCPTCQGTGEVDRETAREHERDMRAP